MSISTAKTIAVCKLCGAFVLLKAAKPPPGHVLWFHCPICNKRVEAVHFQYHAESIEARLP